MSAIILQAIIIVSIKGTREVPMEEQNCSPVDRFSYRHEERIFQERIYIHIV